jgi:hypothetical protein
LATERTNPSTARWAVASRTDEASSGGAASTTTRPPRSTEAIEAWKNSYSARSRALSSIALASKTSAATSPASSPDT